MDPQQQQQKKQSKFQQLQNVIPEEIRQKWAEQQKKIKQKIIQHDDHLWDAENIQLICGVDLSARKQQPDLACVGLVVYNIKTHKVEYEDFQVIKISQPYVPSFLAFREVPPLFHLFRKLKQNAPQFWPQLVILDGNGILHPNQCGLASHLGVLMNLPTVGVGKTFFNIDGMDKIKFKKMCQEIKNENQYVFLKGDSGRIWGAALRNGKQAVNPVIVSIGTKVNLQTAIKVIIRSSIYRVPEPVRLADKKSRQIIEKVDLKADTSQYKKYQMIFIDQLI